ncbi:MAG: cell envelope protein SmpA [Micavibrio sp.]|nr:cell envelope protein SmpA [Micavibrio sp.]|tara:strand:- start:105 stop:572 length:468 start_codon:yes stop_codon:yes gene_type:complete
MKRLNFVSILFFSLSTVALSLNACTPTQATRGNIVEDFRMAELTPGVSTRTNVLKSLGSPTTKAPFDDNVWYYIGQKTEKKGVFDHKVIDEKIVVATFDDEGILQDLNHIDNERTDIPKIRRKTKTGGNEVTVIEQLLGNVGKFNAPDVSATGER